MAMSIQFSDLSHKGSPTGNNVMANQKSWKLIEPWWKALLSSLAPRSSSAFCGTFSMNTSRSGRYSISSSLNLIDSWLTWSTHAWNNEHYLILSKMVWRSRFGGTLCSSSRMSLPKVAIDEWGLSPISSAWFAIVSSFWRWNSRLTPARGLTPARSPHEPVSYSI